MLTQDIKYQIKQAYHIIASIGDCNYCSTPAGKVIGIDFTDVMLKAQDRVNLSLFLNRIQTEIAAIADIISAVKIRA